MTSNIDERKLTAAAGAPKQKMPFTDPDAACVLLEEVIVSIDKLDRP